MENTVDRRTSNVTVHNYFDAAVKLITLSNTAPQTE